MRNRWRKESVLPGFGLTMGYTVFYLGMIVLLPLAALILHPASLGWGGFWQAVSAPRVLAAFRLSFGTSLAAATINLLFGTLVAWVLVRYSFPGRRLFDGMVDLPFALPTAVSGIALTTLYSPNGWIGQCLGGLGIQGAFSRFGIVIALTFIGLPFVVRTLQPAFADLEPEVEEAATSLGATRWQTFRKIIFPAVLPALLTGFALSFARALGEYGSVIFIAGNIPMETEIVPLLIMTKLEQYDYEGATAIAVVMLGLSFLLLLAINMLQAWANRTRA